ncbi:hypothetical protein ACHAWO_004759 [Cyclotella atomus]|jgi:hypothetical protein|uniref:Uncharacterized protein n=1 Tax=Cyclotella atomus TaxID=382360 RepID=A0ABD3Q1V9_9STRA
MTAPSPSQATRGRPATRTCRNTGRSDEPVACTRSVSTTSTSSADSIPRSHSPTSRTSRYAQAVYSPHLAALLNSEGEAEYPGVRCEVKCLRYTNTKLGLSGYYTGSMDVVSKLPDGEGTLFCHDGRIFKCGWRLGGILPMEPIRARRCSDGSSSDTCDFSTCSSVTASVRHLRPRSAEDDAKKLKVPKNLYIITRSPSNMFPEEDMSRRLSTESRVESEGNVSEQTEVTAESSNVFSEYSCRNRDEKLFKWKPFVTKVKSTVCRKA